MLTASVPRVPLGFYPTPLEEMPRLSKALGGPRLFVKRDDQTGLAGGGNKTRKLEFSVADALEHRADALVTLGGVQSNHCRQTAAAAARHGLRCILVLRGERPAAWNGNLLLDHLLGAEVVFSGGRSREDVADEVFRSEQAAGHKPYLIPVGASNEVGAVGFVAGIEELDAQLKAMRIAPNRIVFASSSFGTQAGLCVGAKALGMTCQIAAIAIDCPLDELQREVAALAVRTSRRIGRELAFSPTEIIGFDGYLGGGYAVMGPPEQEAIELVAQTEGILLDPVYTGRAMAGLIDLVRKGEFGQNETIVFWHTGGSAALFAYADQLMGK